MLITRLLAPHSRVWWAALVMHPLERQLVSAVAGAGTALEAADALCQACADVLCLDGVAISMVAGNVSQGTFGSSDARSRRLDELQFTLGEGPSLDAVRDGAPVLAADLGATDEKRWPAYCGEMVTAGVLGAFAFPVTVQRQTVGALDFFRQDRGPLSLPDVDSGLLAARLAAGPLLAMMTAPIDWQGLIDGEKDWPDLQTMERVEIYQATGMLMAAFEISSEEALVRLRAQAYLRGLTASELAWDVVERTVVLDGPSWDGTGNGR